MLGKLHNRLGYTAVVTHAVVNLLEEGSVSPQRARELVAALGQQKQEVARIPGVESSHLESPAYAVARDCAMLYSRAESDGDPARRDYLKLAARALLLGDSEEPLVRVSVDEAIDCTGQSGQAQSRPNNEIVH